MAKKKVESTILQGAQAREAIRGFFAANSGEHKVHEVAEATGLAHSTAGQHLARLAGNGELGMRKEGTAKLYSSEGGGTVTEPAAKRAYKKIPKGRDVELVVGGTLIVIGRNPATGRLRITLEEA